MFFIWFIYSVMPQQLCDSQKLRSQTPVICKERNFLPGKRIRTYFAQKYLIFNHVFSVVYWLVCSNLELPFFWQITKPNLKPLIPEETADFTEVKNNQDRESAFSLNPEQGVLLPYTGHEFILTYAPQEVWLVIPSYPQTPAVYFYSSHKILAVQLF